MATNGKQVYNFGTARLTKFSDFETKTFETRDTSPTDQTQVKDQVDISDYVKNAQLVVDIDTGDATGIGDDGRISSLAREIRFS